MLGKDVWKLIALKLQPKDFSSLMMCSKTIYNFIYILTKQIMWYYQRGPNPVGWIVADFSDPHPRRPRGGYTYMEYWSKNHRNQKHSRFYKKTDDGIIIESRYYNNGLKNGKYIKRGYIELNTLILKNYKRGKRHGLCFKRTYEEVLDYYARYNNGVLNGFYTRAKCDRNRNLIIIEGEYINGKRHGIWKQTQNLMITIFNYNKGTMISQSNCDLEGRLLLYIQYKPTCERYKFDHYGDIL